MHGKLHALHLLADVAILQAGQRIDVMDRGRFRPGVVVAAKGRRCLARLRGCRHGRWFCRIGTHGTQWRVAVNKTTAAPR